jgi:hypothetical protein
MDVNRATLSKTVDPAVIEAPPETASTLAALFSGMAQLLQAAAAPPVTGGRPVRRRSAGTERSR